MKKIYLVFAVISVVVIYPFIWHPRRVMEKIPRWNIEKVDTPQLNPAPVKKVETPLEEYHGSPPSQPDDYYIVSL